MFAKENKHPLRLSSSSAWSLPGSAGLQQLNWGPLPLAGFTFLGDLALVGAQ